MISAAVAFLGVMAVVRSGWTSQADFWTVSMPQIVQGFAMPFFIIPATTLSLAAVLPQETASAAGLQNFLRTMAIAISTSLGLTFWGDAARSAHNELANVVNPGAMMPVLDEMGMSTEQSRRIIDNLVNREATTIAMNHTFLITAVVLFVAAAIVWISPPAKLAQAGPPSH
jgi:DHA2 family multidrug resistance protein